MAKRSHKVPTRDTRIEREPARRSPLATPVDDQTAPRWPIRLVCPLLLIAAGVIVYGNSFDGVFLYDDTHHILEDERVRQLWPPWPLLAHRRPVVMLSLAINYAVGEFDTRGYHLFNVTVHLLAGLTLFGLVRRTLTLDGLRERFGTSATWPAIAVALLWLVHPLQTQSVTYIIQRAESLMGLCYLLTLYCLVRGATSRRGVWWFCASTLVCALGMASKAVMISAPIVALLFDRAFLTRSFRETIRRRWAFYIALAATWVVLVPTGIMRGTFAPPHSDTVMGFGYEGATPWQYLLTQAQVIPHYLRLCFWPDRLCLDYGWPFAENVREVVLPGLLMLFLLGATIAALFRRPRLGFLGAGFFLILAPTSSFVPIQDAAYEHRMYLPLAVVVVFCVLVLHRALARVSHRAGVRPGVRFAIAAVLVLSSATALGARTIKRNQVYHSERAMWRDNVQQAPNNARAHYNLANALRVDDMQAAFEHYREAVRLNPQLAKAQSNLGNMLRLAGRPQEALGHLRKAIERQPDLAEAHTNMGSALADLGRHDEAIEVYLRAIELDPKRAETRYNLGMSLGATGRFGEAIDAFRQAVALMSVQAMDPKTLGQAHYFLGTTLARVGRTAEALTALEEAVRLNPNDARARNELDRLRR